MYQNCCKKCGSIALHTEKSGNNTGLYCDDCGAFQKWLGKDELLAFEYSIRKNKETENVSDKENATVEKLKRFNSNLTSACKKIDSLNGRRSCFSTGGVLQALTLVHKQIQNIIEGREYDDNGE